MLSTLFRARRIAAIDPDWRRVFDLYWPAYERWYRQRKAGDANPRELARAQRELARVMPELLPLYRELLEVADDCPLAAQFLTGYQPPAYLLGCAQALLLTQEPLLIRNYDLSPELSENLVMRSAWHGQPVIGSNECLWGLNDGVNASGLAASITFGGSNRVGRGFGIPFILRYVMQTCETVREAIAQLRRVPSHMAYNVTLVDRRGDFATVMLAPGADAIVTRERCITNHQAEITWPQQAAFSRTRERRQYLRELLSSSALDEARLRRAFLRPPLYNTDYRRQFGTVYTAIYRPESATMDYLWPHEPVWEHGIDDFENTDRTVLLGARPAAEYREAAMPAPVAAPGIPADVRRFLLQGLAWIPPQATGNPNAQAALMRDLRSERQFSWTDYAQGLSAFYCRPASAA